MQPKPASFPPPCLFSPFHFPFPSASPRAINNSQRTRVTRPKKRAIPEITEARVHKACPGWSPTPIIQGVKGSWWIVRPESMRNNGNRPGRKIVERIPETAMTDIQRVSDHFEELLILDFSAIASLDVVGVLDWSFFTSSNADFTSSEIPSSRFRSWERDSCLETEIERVVQGQEKSDILVRNALSFYRVDDLLSVIVVERACPKWRWMLRRKLF